MFKRIALVAIGMALGVCGMSLSREVFTEEAQAPQAQAEQKPPEDQFLEEVMSGLQDADMNKRQEVSGRLMNLRAKTFEGLKKIFEMDKGNAFGSPRNLAIMQMGYWRFEEAAHLLAENIDWRIDPATFPDGMDVHPVACYPAACALHMIGGRAVWAAMVAEIQKTEDDGRLRLCCWVLSETEGEKVALAILEQYLSAGNDESKARLEKAKEYVEVGSGVFSELDK